MRARAIDTAVEFLGLDEPVLPKAVELLRTALPHSPISEGDLRRLVSCPHFDGAGAILAQRDGQAAGLVAAICRGLSDQSPPDADGYVVALAVHADKEGAELGSRLLEMAESYLASRGRRRVLATAFHPCYFFPGIDLRYGFLLDMFIRAGYECYSMPVDMEASLQEYRTPRWLDDARAAVARDGIAVDWAREEHHATFLRFMHDVFPGTWYDRAKEHVESGRDLERATLALDKSGNVAAFVRWGVEGERGWIEGIGVAPELRHRRIGSLLLAEAIEAMTRQGAKRACFGYTGRLRFYERMGAVVTRRYAQFRKTLLDPKTGG